MYNRLRRTTFSWAYGDIPLTGSYGNHDGAVPVTLCLRIVVVSDPSGFGLPLQGLPSDFTTDLPVKL